MARRRPMTPEEIRNIRNSLWKSPRTMRALAKAFGRPVDQITAINEIEPKIRTFRGTERGKWTLPDGTLVDETMY